MRRPLWFAVAAALIGVPALCVISARSMPARVFARTERIHVLQSTGQWYHEYSIQLGSADTSANKSGLRDTVTVPVARNDFDATRIGKRLQVKRVAFWPRIAWIADSASAWQSFRKFAGARVRNFAAPAAISPLDVQMAGLARVLTVHAIQRRTKLWQRKETASSDRSRWIHLVEVEFWAVRARALVRTIDVIDAGSIPGLHPGDIVQMHYDQREPRTMRLDDGMRTFAARP